MLNDDVRDVSADMALMVFQEGLLKTARFAADWVLTRRTHVAGRHAGAVEPGGRGQ